MLRFPSLYVYPDRKVKKSKYDIKNMSEETLTSTFTELRKGFLRLASRFLSNEEDAHDALQEAFCRLWPKRHQIHTRQEAEALTVTTVRNLCIDAIRKQHVQMVELDADRDAALIDSVSDRMEKEEQFREVELLIKNHLSPLQQAILRRKEYEGESIDSIAHDLGMQPTAVRMQLSRARKTIRECYQNIHKHE